MEVTPQARWRGSFKWQSERGAVSLHSPSWPYVCSLTQERGVSDLRDFVDDVLVSAAVGNFDADREAGAGLSNALVLDLH
jgi:hypothetical protein